MEEDACRSCSANVRCAGVGLKSYLSSGKSSAMAISLRPISFHCESTTCEGLGEGVAAGLLAARANTNEVPRDTARASTALAIIFFISSLLGARQAGVSTPLCGRAHTCTHAFDASVNQTAFLWKRFRGFCEADITHEWC